MPTFFLRLIAPRPNFAQILTDSEQEIMNSHAAIAVARRVLLAALSGIGAGRSSAILLLFAGQGDPVIAAIRLRSHHRG